MLAAPVARPIGRARCWRTRSPVAGERASRSRHRPRRPGDRARRGRRGPAIARRSTRLPGHGRDVPAAPAGVDRRPSAATRRPGGADHGHRDLDGDRVYYRLEGAAGRPVVVLSHALGLDHTMWDPQMAALTARFRVLRYDLARARRSDATPGDYTVDQLGRDALALLDRLGLDRVAWCGLSLGGMVGQWLAAHAGERLSCLVLANTSPRIADPAGMEARRRTVLDGGTPRSWTPRWRGSSATRSSPPTRRGSHRRARRCLRRSVGYAGCCAALRDFDGTALLPRSRRRRSSSAATRTCRCRGKLTARRSRRRSPAPPWSGWRPRTCPASRCRARSRGRCSSS